MVNEDGSIEISGIVFYFVDVIFIVVIIDNNGFDEVDVIYIWYVDGEVIDGVIGSIYMLMIDVGVIILVSVVYIDKDVFFEIVFIVFDFIIYL